MTTTSSTRHLQGSIRRCCPTGNQTPPPPPTLPQEKLHTLFAIGGDRANSTPFTAMINTLLLREHNRVAGELETRNPTWDDERVFQTARNIVIPMFIKIVVEHYINHITPLPFSLRADPSVAWTANWNRPNWITVEFSLLYRWHSLMPDEHRMADRTHSDRRFHAEQQAAAGRRAGCGLFGGGKAASGELGAFNTADCTAAASRFSR